MSRKRAWEIGASAGFLLAVVVVLGGFFAWRERQRKLDAELTQLLSTTDANSAEKLPGTSECERLLVVIRQGANVQVRTRSGWTVLCWSAFLIWEGSLLVK